MEASSKRLVKQGVERFISERICFLASGQNMPKRSAIGNSLRVFDPIIRRLSGFDIDKRLIRGEKAVDGLPSRDRKGGESINATFYTFRIRKFHLIALSDGIFKVFGYFCFAISTDDYLHRI
jgi:hypothetical protein